MPASERHPSWWQLRSSSSCGATWTEQEPCAARRSGGAAALHGTAGLQLSVGRCRSIYGGTGAVADVAAQARGLVAPPTAHHVAEFRAQPLLHVLGRTRYIDYGSRASAWQLDALRRPRPGHWLVTGRGSGEAQLDSALDKLADSRG
jgi:hypothetical protein